MTALPRLSLVDRYLPNGPKKTGGGIGVGLAFGSFFVFASLLK